MWNISRPFGIFVGLLGKHFWYVVTRKNWQPCYISQKDTIAWAQGNQIEQGFTFYFGQIF
jgi:hypothetical protein